eukprot:s1756_g19.t1
MFEQRVTSDGTRTRGDFRSWMLLRSFNHTPSDDAVGERHSEVLRHVKALLLTTGGAGVGYDCKPDCFAAGFFSRRVQTCRTCWARP